MILELPRPPQATQQQQQEAGKPLIQLYSSYFYEGKVYNTGSVPFSPSVCNSVADVDPYVLGLLDPDQIVRGTDPDPDPGSFYSQAKIVKNLIPSVL
jgi:hypothetical protein